MSGSVLRGESRPHVLIVGAGVGGLTTSTLLSHYGVTSLLVEKRRETFGYPKARNLTFRSLEILRGLGLGPAVNAVAERISHMVTKQTLVGVDEDVAFDADFFPSAEAFSPEPFGRYCPQSKLEPILLAETRRRGGEVRYGVELVSLVQDEEGIVAVVRDLDTGESAEVRADYLVAADGTYSWVRRHLDITTSGVGALPMFVLFVYFRAPWRRFVPHLGAEDAVRVSNPDVTGIFLVADGDLGMFITTYFPAAGETAEQFTPQRCRELLLSAVGEPIEVELVDVAPWQPYEQVADQFRSGRVFLVGDSAHTMPPLKGGGANTAIQSAQNLAWKLAMVLDGTAGPEVLETYHAERHPVGRFAARQSLTGPGVAFLKVDGHGPALPADEELPLFYMIAGYQYRSDAIISTEPAPADPDVVQLVEGEQLRGMPGTRVPHVWVVRDGKRLSTLDLLGPGFTLLTGAAGGPWQAAADSVAGHLGVPIEVCSISATGDACDANGGWGLVTKLPPEGALLIRPDDFVGWRVEVLPDDPEGELRQALSMILSRS